jgi:hypothetical protein
VIAGANLEIRRREQGNLSGAALYSISQKHRIVKYSPSRAKHRDLSAIVVFKVRNPAGILF